MKALTFLFCALYAIQAMAQSDTILKIHHAEPLYMDLIRDLGARKGEKEWNVGGAIQDERQYISYTGFIEYEFSPLNRWGLEVEVPFSFYQSVNTEKANEEMPRHRVEGIKTAAQYTFWVSGKQRLSMAAGYMNELKLHSFATISDRRDVIKGNTYSPFLIVGKRWGPHFHSLLYTGPVWEQNFSDGIIESSFQLNTSVHYVIPGTPHFIGMELNQEFGANISASVLRPQAKVKISQGLYLGILTGIPLSFENQRMSFMMRVIYEPKKKLKR